jgi:chromosome segregation ATPase
MPSADDLFNQLKAANNRLEDIKDRLLDVKSSTDLVKASVDQVNSTLNSGFSQLVSLGQYANEALWHNARQNDAIICILEHISKNTCELLNQSVIQTRLQTEMQKDIDALENMYEHVHADAALERERLLELKKQIEVCCPPPRPESPCKYAPCPAPPPLREPQRGSAPVG